MLELTVADWKKSVAWYRDCMGFTVETLDEPHAFAVLNSGTSRLSLKGGTPQLGSIIPFFQVDDLLALLNRLAEHGVHRDGELRRSDEGYRRAFIRDPDGYRIGLFEWTTSAPKDGAS
jgi:predicted enzyme related to lactoylglutathione lyase